MLFPCSTSPAAEAQAPAAAGGSSGSTDGSIAQQQSGLSEPNPLFNSRPLQLWILRGCQQLKGGLRDKPGKSADYYHTCYCLSGLSAAQHVMGGCVVGPVDPDVAAGAAAAASKSSGGGSSGWRKGVLKGSNELALADPLLNVVVEKVQEAKQFFKGQNDVV